MVAAVLVARDMAGKAAVRVAVVDMQHNPDIVAVELQQDIVDSQGILALAGVHMGYNQQAYQGYMQVVVEDNLA